ncbi:MAG: hypothetical protein HY695_38365 [Deltaproteobacteria bacterium]|nr:hypothetical protein [Deltaproteobacteria bacterium]
MDDKEFKTRASRLEQIAKVLEKLPAEVRSDAFDLLKGYVTEHSSPPRARTKETKGQRDAAAQSEEEFFGAFDHDKPADNAKLVAAWFYREYGAEPFSLDEVRAKADAVGITVPARVDMTFVQAKEKGKKLFARAGTGKFKPTVHGEANLKSIYSVKKGTKKREGDAE